MTDSSPLDPDPKEHEAADLVVAAMLAAREARAVKKLRIANLRSRVPDLPILVFEGTGDVVVFVEWIRRCRGDVAYEPFSAGNKDAVFQTIELLQEDKTGLDKNIYFFVDRDFDDLRGRTFSLPVHMTDRYSIENYLVGPDIVQAFIIGDLECAGQPEARQRAVEMFLKDYSDFLLVSRYINLLLFAAKRQGCEVIDKPERINQLAQVDVGAVIALSEEQILASVGVEPPLDLAALPSVEPEFSELDPHQRYRGKFNLLFQTRWLSRLADRRRAGDPIFDGCPQVGRIRSDFDSLALLAARSPLPLKLEDFLQQVFP